MKVSYWTKTPGIGGKIESPEDFFVKEILHGKYFAKYRTSGTVRQEKGKYNLFLLRKRNMTTHDALKVISTRFKNSNIGFAGLKDKFAVTEQYVTLKGASDFAEKNIQLVKIGSTDRFLSKGDLIGNEFIITLRGCTNTENLPKIVEEVGKGMPNYFGPQRFGIYGNNHVIGRLVVKKDFRKALELINNSYREKYGDIFRVPKTTLKFFVNAYQAWIFNQLLNEYVRKGKYFKGYLPVVGCNTKNINRAEDTMKKEGIKTDNFMIGELRLACSGGKRKAFIKTYVDYSIIGSKAVLKFALPAGSYATVVLKEICKGAFHDR